MVTAPIRLAFALILGVCIGPAFGAPPERVRPPRPPYQVPSGAPQGPFAGYKPDTPATDAVVQKAKRIAGNNFAFLWDRYCNPLDRWGRNRARGVSEPGTADLGLDFSDMPPTKMFDNLYYVGMTEVAAYAITTRAGIILIDTLDNPAEAEQKIVGGLKKYGLDPRQIKYVIVMHGHADHYGGARYLQDKYHPRVVASAVDWPMILNGGDKAPRKDVEAVNGTTITLGGQTVRLYLSPGHTPGTLNASFTVYDRGKPHQVVFWGGSNFPSDKDGISDYAYSAARLRGVADAIDADVVIGNHPQIEGTTWLLRQYIADPAPPNPLIIGHQAVDEFIDTFFLCATAARMRLTHE